MEILAYFEEWSRRPGERVRMAISTPRAEVHAVFERLVTGPGAAGEARVGTEDRSDVLDVRIPGRIQRTAVGSYAKLPLPAGGLPSSVTVYCHVWPTVPDRAAPQSVWSLAVDSGMISLQLHNGRFALRSAEGTVLAQAELRVFPRHWYSVVASLGPAEVLLDVSLDKGLSDRRRATVRAGGLAYRMKSELLLAAAGVDAVGSSLEPFNGKIEAPVVFSGTLNEEQATLLHRGENCCAVAIAEWAVDQDWDSPRVAARHGDCPDGILMNGVERAVTGHNWNGTSDSFLQVPHQYAALQFHEDDVVDSGWEYDLDFALPSDLESGIYCVRLTAGETIERYPLFVAAAANEAAPILFLVPTNTYLAYSNDHLSNLDYSAVVSHQIVVPENERQLFENREFGRSCYDTHSDGTPVRYASRRRPLINVRPGFPNWLTGSYRHFSADLYFIEWLERTQLDYHIATDEDLERDGPTLLDKYRVILTGSHPEYWTTIGRDHLESYLKRGGKLMYLGGNGFYWVTSRDHLRPWLIEVRRDNSGTRSWDAPAGERTHATTAEAGGIWRMRGKGPNILTGVGFDSEGWSKASGYRRTAASRSAFFETFFEGVHEDIIGDFGHILGGAVGDEVDRCDVELGSPPHAHILASSTGLGNEYQLAVEDQILAMPNQGGRDRPDKVKADMVYFAIEGGGAVFSVGSMAYVGALAWNDFDNNIARLTNNVLRSFVTGRK